MDKNGITIGHLSTTYHTNFLLMDDPDFKQDIDRNISWKLFGTGPAMVEAFTKGELDIGYMGLPPAIIGIDKGAPIKCIAGGHVEGTIMISRSQYKPIFSLNESIGDVLAQFRGKVIGTPSRGSIHDVIINHYLEKFDLKEEIELRNYKQAELIALDMQQGKLDGGVGTPALAAYAETLLNSHLIIPANLLIPNNPSYGIFFSERLIQSNPEVGKIFLNHHKKASEILRESKERAVNLICKSMDVLHNNKKYVKDVLEISPKYCIALSNEYLQSTQFFVNILFELGYIQKKLNVEDFCNFQFIREIHPEEHHYYSN